MDWFEHINKLTEGVVRNNHGDTDSFMTDSFTVDNMMQDDHGCGNLLLSLDVGL